MKKMNVAAVTDINTVKVEERDIPKIKPGHALIKVAYSGFCGPTEMAIIGGLHPRAKFPLVLGHEFSGIVEQIEADGPCDIKTGDKVVIYPLIYCNECDVCKSGNQHICKHLKLIGIDRDGGNEEYCLAPVKNLVKIPNDMLMDIAALTEPMAVAIHAVKESGFNIGDSALVFGAGPIGLMVAEACKLSAAGNVTVVDINEDRLKLAAEMGYCVSKDPNKLVSIGMDKFDFVYDTTGAPAVLPAVVECTRIRGFIGIVGKFDFPAPVNLHDILFNEISLKGFRVYREKEFLYANRLLYENQEKYSKYISDIFRIEEINEAVETFIQRKNLARIMISF